MVETQEETKLCKNCERLIEVSKFRMHDMQCARMNYKCKECGQVVQKSDKEEHENEAHVKVKCKYCDYAAFTTMFGTHEETCEMKPKACQYCNQVFTIERWVNHVEQCGVKTQKCEKCQRYIMNKDWESHPLEQCQKNCFENEAKRQAEITKNMQEIAKQQEQQKREIEQKQREKKEKEQQAAAQKAQKEKEELQKQQQAAAVQQQQRINAANVNVKPSLNSLTQNQKQPASQARPTTGVPQQQLKPSVQSGSKLTTDVPASKSQVQRPSQHPVQSQVRKPEEMKQPAPIQKPTLPKPIASKKVTAPSKVEDQTIDELNAALIAQLVEEDASRILAEQLQNESFGGSAGLNPPARPGVKAPKQNDPYAVRAADQQQFGRLDGFGEEDFVVQEDPDWGRQTSKDMKAALQASMKVMNKEQQEEEEILRAIEMSKKFR